MAAAGIASRRACEQLIAEGRVTVNGELVATPATLVTPAADTVRVDGGPPLARRPAEPLYFVVNKPKGYLCSADSPDIGRGRPDGRRPKLVTDLLARWLAVWRARHTPPPGTNTPPPRPPRLFTVGRLDAASTGLILITNDGAWANAVAHPASGLTKEYVVTLARPPSRADLELLAAGTTIDGTAVAPVAVHAPSIIPGDPLSRRRIRVVIAEGRNREVRRLAEAADHDVTGLKRVRVGGLKLPKGLGLGGVKQLDAAGAARVVDLGLQGNYMAHPWD
jgi:pseudouridine synthase